MNPKHPSGIVKVIARWWAVSALLLGAVRGTATEEPVAAETAREPVIRKIETERDAAAHERIRVHREKLPEAFQKMNNFAWARADIRGLRKKEYYAHSRIQSLDNMSSNVARQLRGISPKPAQEDARFTTLFVDYQGNIGGPNAIPRWFDTEYKILEDIAARLPDPSVKGRILLYTDLEPCLSCRGVMQQFLAIYTNVEMEVLYDWP